jgi:hypothetical protein
MTRPRRALVEATSSQSIEEAVKDLGDLYSIGLSNIHTEGSCYFPKDLGHWQAMTRHVKLLRVVEEGRREPKKIAALLNSEINRSMDGFEQMEGQAAFALAMLVTDKSTVTAGSVSEKDEFYRREHRYENPLLEYQRRIEAAYAAFYALANIGELDSPCLLAKWIELRHPPMTNAKDMHIWLIHQYFQQAGARHSAEAIKHDALTSNMSLSSGSCTRSRWNALWDVDDPLLKAKKIDVSGIATINVLAIPQELDGNDTTKDAVIANFLAHAHRLE